MTKRLIIAFDVGTTFSGVSYAFQDGPAQQPEIHGVTRFPGFMGADSKIPSQVLYRQEPTVQPYRIGSEVDEFEQDCSEEAIEILGDCIKVQWFKILLRPGQLSPPGEIKTQLPVGTGPIQVFADYLQYLHECTMKFIQETHINSAQLLDAVGNNIHYVLTHPNGWVGPQQARIRSAAAKAGLVDTAEDKHLHLLTEGEASINFCVQQGLAQDLITETDGIAVIDAGGGTVDISAYRSCPGSTDKNGKMKLEEITDARCLMRGSIFVTLNAEQYLKKHLKQSKYKADIDHITAQFDRMAKLRFRSSESNSFIKFGKIGDTEPEFNIRNGQIMIPGKQMAEFFEPSIEEIVDTFKDIKESPKSSTVIKRALLVGGFAASEYLYTELKERLKPFGVELYRPDRHLNKAVANGAVAHFLNRAVVARVAKHTLGTECSVRFKPENAEHLKRYEKTYINVADGYRYVPGLFWPIITKESDNCDPPSVYLSHLALLQGTSVKDSDTPTEYTRPLEQAVRDGKFPQRLSAPILEYRGDLPGTEMQWMDVEPENYETLCTVECKLRERTLVDLHKVPKRTGNAGCQYAACDYDVSLFLGAPELSAQMTLRYQLPKRKAVEVKSEPAIEYVDGDSELN